MTSFSWPRAVIALAGFLMLGAVKADAQIATRQVLLLQSFGRGYLVYDSFAGDFRVELDRLAGVPINVVQVVAGPTGSIAAPDSAVLDYVHSNFAGRRAPDLIVTLGGPAAIFAQKYRQQLFPEAPLVFASVYQKFLVDVPLADNETAVAVNNDLATPIEDMLHVLPETRQVFMILGSGPLAKLWRREVEESLKRFDKRLTLIWSGDMSFEQLLRRSSTLPPRTAILFYMFGADAAGSAYADERVLGDLHAAANAPMFAMHSVYFGRGIVGGRLVDIEGLARKTADVAVRILCGAPPSSLRMAPQLQGAPVFDWRELQRWDIPESRLPTGAI